MASTNTAAAGKKQQQQQQQQQHPPASAPKGGAAPAPLDEDDLEEKLYRLDMLRRLRSALPRMLEPLMAQQPSPQAVFAAYMQSIEDTNKEIAAFQEAIQSLQTDGVLTKSGAGHKGGPLRMWCASEHPDWANPDRKRRRVS
ncbi:hypothetical protein C8A05DRAFT_11750 [Staphylotrichum tortipilum]|uniref:Uncharacterized protein n=1 Tax=Staphylotrichum tortipilum TaxID=2831512 RepID=A0AAN6MUG0_9PEZI|nr:hypothetical protein C8A05DRAFT_11750 [Staphylotrichum longicolle]